MFLLTVGVSIAPRPTSAAACNFCWCGARDAGGVTSCLDNFGSQADCAALCSGQGRVVIHCDSEYLNYNQLDQPDFRAEAPSCAPEPAAAATGTPPGAAAAPTPGAGYTPGAVVANLAESGYNPLGTTSLAAALGKVIRAFIGITGTIALVMFVYGGFLWLTSGGSQEQITKGKNVLVWSSLGLLLIFAAYALVNFVLTKLVGVV